MTYLPIYLSIYLPAFSFVTTQLSQKQYRHSSTQSSMERCTEWTRIVDLHTTLGSLTVVYFVSAFQKTPKALARCGAISLHSGCVFTCPDSIFSALQGERGFSEGAKSFTSLKRAHVDSWRLCVSHARYGDI